MVLQVLWLHDESRSLQLLESSINQVQPRPVSTGELAHWLIYVGLQQVWATAQPVTINDLCGTADESGMAGIGKRQFISYTT